MYSHATKRSRLNLVMVSQMLAGALTLRQCVSSPSETQSLLRKEARKWLKIAQARCSKIGKAWGTAVVMPAADGQVVALVKDSLVEGLSWPELVEQYGDVLGEAPSENCS